jgi:hypothetical protein
MALDYIRVRGEVKRAIDAERCRWAIAARLAEQRLPGVAPRTAFAPLREPPGCHPTTVEQNTLFDIWREANGVKKELNK